MTTTPSVAIVILNWNGKSFLEQFLPSVLATVYSNLQVWVADNASTDDSVTFLQQHFPQVQLICLKKNWGFAEGYNLALWQIESDYYVLLNSDVSVEPEWLQPIIDWLEKDKTYGAAQPKIRSYHQPQFFEYAGAAGGWIDTLGYPFARGRVLENLEADAGQYNHTAPIFWASGAAMVVKRKAYWDCGGLDAGFFAHQEEIDLCWRMQLQGYKIFCVGQSTVFHVGGGTLPRGASQKTFLNFRNNLTMLAKNLPTVELVWKLPLRMGLDWAAGVVQLRTVGFGYLKVILRAHVAFTQSWLTGKLRRSPRRKPLASLPGVYRGSILWQVMVRGRKNFSRGIKEA